MKLLCSDCKCKKSEKDFTRNKQRKTGYSCYCKICQPIRAKKYNSKEIVRARNLKRFHNITPDIYDAILKSQNGNCAICDKPERYRRAGKILALAIDHSHSTQKRRGLLCGRCNLAIGLFEDNLLLLEKAIKYLS